MSGVFTILCQLCIIKGVFAELTYFHERSFIEIQPPVSNHESDFGYSIGYSSKKNKLVIGAPHHNLNGKVFDCPTEGIFAKSVAVSSEIDIDIEKLAGDYSRDQAPDQNFCLGASIAVASDFILTCAPLWRTETKNTLTKFKYGTYGTCFVISEKGITRLEGAYEQLAKIKRARQRRAIMGKVFGGSGWSTMIDETNNITLISLAPFSQRTDIGYMKTSPPLDSMKFVNVYKEFDDVFKDMGTFVSGTFFEVGSVAYAFSSRRERMSGVIAFLQQPTNAKGQWEVMINPREGIPLYIEPLHVPIGSMFGAALGSADLNSDGFSDLIVGAPAQGRSDYLLYDSGAIHIFLGGDKKKMIETKKKILFNKSGGYFGATIATKDIDGDKLTEIFVSAPFEDAGSGAVYILNGQEMEKFVKNNQLTVILLSDLKLTQRLNNANYKSFGYSLQPLPDLDKNGYSELAIGAPNSGKVLLYRSISTMLVKFSAEIDRDYVRESDKNCSITLKIDIKYPVRPATLSQKLVVTMNVVGNGVEIDGENIFKQNITDDKSSYDRKVTVIFTNEEPGLYIFTADVSLDSDENLNNEALDKYRMSPYSDTSASVRINRRCKGEDCAPILSSTIQFSGGEKSYTIGSSTNEVVTVTILNKGNDTFDSCAKILITGSEVLYANTEQDSMNWYQYLLPPPFERGESHTIEIKLDMSKQSNIDKKLQVKVALYNICNRGDPLVVEKEFNYDLNTKDIYVDGLSYKRNITDTEILDTKRELITDDHVYTVINNGTVTWKKIHAFINVKKEKFIKACHISEMDSLSCIEQQNNDSFTFDCFFDLEKYVKFVITFDIMKDMFKNSLVNRHLSTSSTFELNLRPTDMNVNQLTTNFYYKIDVSWSQNKSLIIVGAVILAAVTLLALTFVLYKRGFFKNPDKTKLENLIREVKFKESIRRQEPAENLTLPETGQENIERAATAGQETNEEPESSVGCKTHERRLSREDHGIEGHEKRNTQDIKSLRDEC